jgi:hypothetical protein
MLGNVVCWAIALGMLFPKFEGFTEDYKRMVFAMCFMLIGILCKAVDVYRDTHTIEVDVREDENGRLVIDKK